MKMLVRQIIPITKGALKKMQLLILVDNKYTMKNIFKTLLTLSFLFILIPTFAQAGVLEGVKTVTESGFGKDASNQLLNPSSQIYIQIGNVINVVLGTLGVILLVIIIYSGFLWLTAGGKSDQVETAQSYIKNAFIGLIIISSAYLISDFIITLLSR